MAGKRRPRGIKNLRRDHASEEHPLLNPLVLRQIFGNLSRDDLVSSRLVHSHWNQEAIPILKKDGAPLIFNYEPNPGPYTKKRAKMAKYLTKLTNCINLSEGFPFTCFEFHLSESLPGSGLEWNSVIQTLASFVRKLHLFCDDLDPLIRDSHPTPVCLPDGLRFPQLRKLDTVVSGDFIPTIVKHAPKLMCLKLEDPDLTCLRGLICCSQDKLKLQKFSVNFTEQHQTFPKAVLEEYLATFYNFLRSQRENLRALEVRKWDRVRKMELNTTTPPRPPLVFESLTKALLGNVDSTFLRWLLGEKTGERMHLAIWFPVLTTVTIFNPKGKYREYLEQSQAVKSLQTLNFSSCNYAIFATSQRLLLEHGPRIFPNVSALSIYANVKDLWKLVEQLKSLVKLEVIANWQTPELDPLFTGLSAEQCKELRKGGLTKRQFEVKLKKMKVWNPLETGSRSALHRIRELCVDYNGVRPIGVCRFSADTLVSDVTCRLVFLQMRSLNSLILRSWKEFNFTHISEAVRKEMREKIAVLGIQ